MKKTIILALATAALVVPATALPTLDIIGTGKGRNTKISLNNGGDFDSVFAGELKLELITGIGTTQFRGFCTDADLRAPGGSWGVQILDTNSLHPNGSRIAYLVNKYLPGITASGSNDEGRALQLAIWELSEETSNTFDLTSGSFRAKETNNNPLSAATLTWTQTYLADVGSGVGPFYASNLDGNGRQLSQNMVTAVPEPASIAAIGIGLAAVLRRRRRR